MCLGRVSEESRESLGRVRRLPVGEGRKERAARDADTPIQRSLSLSSLLLIPPREAADELRRRTGGRERRAHAFRRAGKYKNSDFIMHTH